MAVKGDNPKKDKKDQSASEPHPQPSRTASRFSQLDDIEFLNAIQEIRQKSPLIAEISERLAKAINRTQEAERKVLGAYCPLCEARLQIDLATSHIHA